MHCPPCLGLPQDEPCEGCWEGAAGGPRARWARGGAEQVRASGAREARVGRGDHGANGEGRPGLSECGASGSAETLLDLRPDELLDTEEGTLDLDSFLAVCVEEAGLCHIPPRPIKPGRCQTPFLPIG